MDQTTEELESKLSELEMKTPDLVKVQNAFWRTTPQTSVLLKETPSPKPVKITSSAKRFTPDRPFFLESILFYSDNHEKLVSSLTLTVKPLDKPALTIPIHTSSNIKFAYAYIRNFCEWFEFHSDSKFIKPTLNKISVYGADIELLLILTEDIKETIKLKSEISKLTETTKKEHTDLLNKIEELQTEKDELDESIVMEKNAYDNLVTNNQLLNDKLTDETKKLQQTNWELNQKEISIKQSSNNNAQLEAEAADLNKKISSLNSKLQELTADKNLISDEYGPYVKEGRSQAIIYVALIILPLAAILFSVYELYMGASKLIATEYKSTTEILASFILRIPFAAVFGLAIYYSWRLTSAIIQKIFTIHSDRLTLAKLLVLAREAVHSSARNLDIASERVFQEQLSLKIEVLKSHLSKDLGNKFEYTPIKMESSNKQSHGEATNDKTIETEDVEATK